VTGDHSTPAALAAHSWHPVPFLLYSKTARADGLESFTEKNCSRGSLGVFTSVSGFALALAHALKLEKYGA
jgi:2,3-bisphosphoglycerate-independent phosphoglycerate mutase